MKAQSNWEEKSQYLLREIVKYDLYIDSLQIAMTLRLKKRGEKGTLFTLSFCNITEGMFKSIGACSQWLWCNQRSEPGAGWGWIIRGRGEEVKHLLIIIIPHGRDGPAAEFRFPECS